MKGLVRVSRRTVLRALAGAVAAGVLSGGGVLLHCARRRDRSADVASRLMLAFDEPGDAVAVGRRYLRRAREEADAGRMAGLIERDTDVDPSSISCRASAATALARQCRADFRSGHVVWVDGWLMARTEARVCALLAMSEPTRVPA